MKNSTKVSTNSKQHEITLPSHSTANPIDTINAFRVEWDFLNETPDLFTGLIAANIRKYADRYGIDLFSNGHELCDYVNSVWLEMYDHLFSISGVARLEKSISNKCAKGKTETILFHPMWQSIDVVVKRTWRKKVSFKKVTNASGEVVTEKITMEIASDPAMPEHQSDSVSFEDQVITSVAVTQDLSKRDQIDQLIAKFTVYGYSNREIGKLIGKSDVTVGKRLNKMRADFRAAGLR